jgi:short-chain fatty acids transporter
VGIVVQFPLYSGIQGLMFGAGLAAAVSLGFVEAAQQVADTLSVGVRHTFPLATLFSAGVVNFFVPSGGGQWIVQGPIMCGAAQSLAVPYDQTVMAIAYGDQLTNMVQPFWAIPLMGMTRVNARAFMGYCALLMLLALPVFAVALMLF